MKPRLHLKPSQLVLVGLCGFVISAASLPLIRYAHPKDGCIRWIPSLLIFCLFLLGFVVSLRASTALRKGVGSQQWPEEQLEPLRSWLESPLCQALPMALLITYGVLWLIFPKYRAIGLGAFLLMQVLSQLRVSVQRPFPSKRSTILTDWRDYLAPIQSNHWGEH